MQKLDRTDRTLQDLVASCPGGKRRIADFQEEESDRVGSYFCSDTPLSALGGGKGMTSKRLSGRLRKTGEDKAGTQTEKITILKKALQGEICTKEGEQNELLQVD